MKTNINSKNYFFKYQEFIKNEYESISDLERKIQLNPRAITNLGGDSVYLTFDMCPSDTLDEDIIDYLISNKIESTFLLSYKWWDMNKNKDLSFLKNPLFSVQCHGYLHKNINGLSEDEQIIEIDKGIEFIKSEFNPNTKYYRFPHGFFTDFSLDYLNSKEIQFLAWAGRITDRFSGYDGKEKNEKWAQILNTVLNTIKSGDILIFHANGMGYRTLDSLKLISTKKLNFKKIL